MDGAERLNRHSRKLYFAGVLHRYDDRLDNGDRVEVRGRFWIKCWVEIRGCELLLIKSGSVDCQDPEAIELLKGDLGKCPNRSYPRLDLRLIHHRKISDFKIDKNNRFTVQVTFLEGEQRFYLMAPNSSIEKQFTQSWDRSLSDLRSLQHEYTQSFLTSAPQNTDCIIPDNLALYMRWLGSSKWRSVVASVEGKRGFGRFSFGMAQKCLYFYDSKKRGRCVARIRAIKDVYYFHQNDKQEEASFIFVIEGEGKRKSSVLGDGTRKWSNIVFFGCQSKSDVFQWIGILRNIFELVYSHQSSLPSSTCQTSIAQMQQETNSQGSRVSPYSVGSDGSFQGSANAGYRQFYGKSTMSNIFSPMQAASFRGNNQQMVCLVPMIMPKSLDYSQNMAFINKEVGKRRKSANGAKDVDVISLVKEMNSCNLTTSSGNSQHSAIKALIRKITLPSPNGRISLADMVTRVKKDFNNVNAKEVEYFLEEMGYSTKRYQDSVFIDYIMWRK